MGAALFNTVLSKDKDALCIPNRRQAVCDNDGRSVFRKLLQRFLYDILALVIQSTCCFIEDKDRRVLQEHSRNREPLLLAAGEFDAALSNIGIVTIRKFHDEVMCISKLGCFDYLFPGCTGSAIADILDYRTGEKLYILLHDSDVIPEALELDVTDIFAVDLYRAVSNIVKSRNEAAESCLTAA